MKRAQQFGCLKMTSDTVTRFIEVKGDTVTLKIPVFADSAYIDSILNTIKDTCITKEAAKTIFRTVPCKVNPYHNDTADYTLDIKVVNGFLDVDLKIKPKVIKTQEITHANEAKTVVEVIPWYIKVLIGCLISGMLGSILLNLSYAFKKK